MPDVISERTANGTSVITIDRPPVNALTLDTILEIERAFHETDGETPIVLTGANDVFSAGVDTRAFARYAPEQRAEMILAITRMTATILSHPAPLVTAAPGHALGGGFVLMLCGDVRLAADAPQARFGLTEAKAGVPFPAGPLEIIRDGIEPNLLRRLTLSSETIGADEMSANGLIDQIVPANELIDQAQSLAFAMAAQTAFTQVKQQIRGPLIRRVCAQAESGEDPLARQMSQSGT